MIGYLQALHEQPTNGGLALGGLGPVSEGLWAWIIGLGGLIFFAMWIAAKGAKAK
jgi:ubiquinol-cytochrome c reductase cytochrome c subunit